MDQSGKHNIGGERFGKIRKAVEKVKKEVPDSVLENRLEKGHKAEKAYEQYPHGKKLDIDARKAEIRRRVSQLMFEDDTKNLSAEEQDEVIERQIDRFYRYDIGNKDIHGHLDAPHGSKPADDNILEWCESHKVVAFEGETDVIAQSGVNNMVFYRSRLLADVNSLPHGVTSSLRSEGAVYTQEDNLNAVKAQRDLTAKILKESDNLDANGQAIRPHLAIHVHGKVDTRGHDFEIGAKQKDGKGPVDTRFVFWFAEKLNSKLASRSDMKNAKVKLQA